MRHETELVILMRDRDNHVLIRRVENLLTGGVHGSKRWRLRLGFPSSADYPGKIK
ncbi:MAG: hypothetical protein H7Y20_13965 [Bryobacteraceae bacterium]|nr:hypothetical protein [Bryobacteraceae bacterium]